MNNGKKHKLKETQIKRDREAPGSCIWDKCYCILSARKSLRLTSYYGVRTHRTVHLKTEAVDPNATARNNRPEMVRLCRASVYNVQDPHGDFARVRPRSRYDIFGKEIRNIHITASSKGAISFAEKGIPTERGHLQGSSI